MSHHVPGPPDYDVVMTEQVPGLNGPKMLGRHKPTAPSIVGTLHYAVETFHYIVGTLQFTVKTFHYIQGVHKKSIF